jgi:thiol-disulfide isomerase/thioredoxin
MMNFRSVLPIVLCLLGCKQGGDAERQAAPTTPPQPSQPAPADAARADAPAKAALTWYRASLRGKNGVEAFFFMGVPAANTPGDAIIKVGRHEVPQRVTFDGKTLEIPMPVQQCKFQATVGPDGGLTGTLSGTWRVIGNWSLPLVATKVAAPTASALATVPGDAPVLDLGEPRTVWKVKLKESGIAKLVVTQLAPGDFEGLLFIDTGNLMSMAGNGRGDALVLTGTDGFSSYRLELTLDKERKHARGLNGIVARAEKPETLTATRGADFAFTTKPRAERPGVKIALPDLPEVASLPRGPLVVEIGGTWCATCRLAAPLLHDLYSKYHSKGLQMITLLYELTDDPKQDAEQAAMFKTTYEVPWTVVAVPGSVDKFVDIIPQGITNVDPSGFPMMFFLDADRSLVAIHAGFPPPDSEEFAVVAAEFRANIEKLLAKPAAPP